jgi:hypothetical protein
MISNKMSISNKMMMVKNGDEEGACTFCRENIRE